MVRSILRARFSMNAELLRWTGVISTPSTPIGTGGTWETYQDPITFQVMNRWVPQTVVADDPLTGANEFVPLTIDCIVRGIGGAGGSGAVSGQGNSEIFAELYRNIEVVRMWTPPDVVISKRDRITNIRDKRGGTVIWRDEEYDISRPTVFEVQGVTPQFDPFNKHNQNFVLLEKVQGYEQS